MKHLFSGFYNSNDSEARLLWNDERAVFIFDTNALLLLYRCEQETREAFFSQWEKIKERVWLPYHVCLEYQRNRLAAIKDHVMELKNAGDNISNKVNISLDDLGDKDTKTIGRYESLRGKLDELREQLKSTVDIFVSEQITRRISEADFLTNHDTVRDKITQLVGDRIGPPPNQDYIDTLQSEGEIRYNNQIPPGYEDAKNKKESTFTFNGVIYKRKFGDWFIWSEILNYCEQNNSAAVIYVTNDFKEDWWYEIGGRKRGAQESLKTELANKCHGAQFILYSSSSFLHAANEYLTGETTSKEIIQEIERVSKKDSFMVPHSIDWQEYDDLLESGLNSNAIAKITAQSIGKRVPSWSFQIRYKRLSRLFDDLELKSASQDELISLSRLAEEMLKEINQLGLSESLNERNLVNIKNMKKECESWILTIQLEMIERNY